MRACRSGLQRAVQTLTGLPVQFYFNCLYPWSDVTQATYNASMKWGIMSTNFGNVESNMFLLA
jgi:hypothetical protein